MGKLKVIKSSPLATIQDFGRFGHRRYGIPQSGAMDKEAMITANQMVGNPDEYPIVEFAIGGMKLETIERTSISIVGATVYVNGTRINSNAIVLEPGDIVETSAPKHVYSYLGIGGMLESKQDFGSRSTYLLAGFGGMEGREIRMGDTLESKGSKLFISKANSSLRVESDLEPIQVLKGPEWGFLKELPDAKIFEIDSSSNRMGIRLKGKLACDFQEIASSAVVPGTIQLPSNGEPIVLMNDCQTTGGYPRIGKVKNEDLGKLAQLKGGAKITFVSS